MTCECGERRELRYGERWQCDGCSRRYDTNRIPVEEYAQIRRSQLRHRILPSAVAIAVAAAVAFLILSHRAIGTIVLIPFVGFAWSQFVRPARREKRFKQLSELPRWEINAD